MQHQHAKQDWTKEALASYTITKTQEYDYVEMKWQETNDKKHNYWYCPICFVVVRVET